MDGERGLRAEHRPSRQCRSLPAVRDGAGYRPSARARRTAAGTRGCKQHIRGDLQAHAVCDGLPGFPRARGARTELRGGGWTGPLSPAHRHVGERRPVVAAASGRHGAARHVCAEHGQGGSAQDRGRRGVPGCGRFVPCMVAGPSGRGGRGRLHACHLRTRMAGRAPHQSDETDACDGFRGLDGAGHRRQRLHLAGPVGAGAWRRLRLGGRHRSDARREHVCPLSRGILARHGSVAARRRDAAWCARGMVRHSPPGSAGAPASDAVQQLDADQRSHRGAGDQPAGRDCPAAARVVGGHRNAGVVRAGL